MTREDAIDVLKNNFPSACFTDLCDAVEIAIQALSTQPEIIRCKDCAIAQHDELFGRWYCNGKEVKPDGYCSDGDRKAAESE